MNLLIDSREFIWWADSPNKLSAKALAALTDGTSILYLSPAGIWEMRIKVLINKLSFQRGLKNTTAMQVAQNNLQILPIIAAQIYELENLPSHHKDPFDRLLIAQAKIKNLTIVTNDSQFAAYGANLL